MNRAERRHITRVKHARRMRLWKSLHPWRAGFEHDHRAKFWPMRCRCDYCARSRTRYNRIED